MAVSIVVRYRPTGLTREQYADVSRRMEEAGAWPPDALEMHVLFGSDGDLRVSEIWIPKNSGGLSAIRCCRY
jgi:hypothetical protein